MNILLAHFRVGETDGVSLEMDKWKWALESLGHRVFYLAGSSGQGVSNHEDAVGLDADLLSELHYADPLNERIIHNAYVSRDDYPSDQALVDTIEAQAATIATGIADVIRKRAIDIIVPNNIWSLGYHLPAGLGLLRAVLETQTRVICHHHDFHWEREKYSQPTSPQISQLLTSTFPPKHPLISHCVINRIAQSELKSRRDIEARVIPNVFDFDGSDWQIDPYNRDLRERFGVRPHDVMFLQATRIVARKGIELTIDLLNSLEQYRDQMVGQKLYNGEIFQQDSRLVLTLAGMSEDAPYLDKLVTKAQALGVELLFINQWVDHSRRTVDGDKVYSLWDVYCHADIISYPSLLEGWGNQFLEGLVAKLPMMVYRYPVYDLDIADYCFNIIDLGNQHQLDKAGLASIAPKQLDLAVQGARDYLFNPTQRGLAMAENYQIGGESLSYSALKALLKEVFA